MADLNARDTKLVQYLNEAFAKEKQLEQALEAHIAMTTLAPYRKRLKQHLTETKRHAREVERRIKRLGGKADGISGVVQDATLKAHEVAAKGAALAQGPIHLVRGTSEPETLLKNARTEFKEEAEEIAHYTAIQKLAESVGDKDTARLAKAILREEKRMAGFLEKLIPRLTKQVVQAEIPPRERTGGRRKTSGGTPTTARRKTTTSRRKATTSRRKATTARRKTTTSRRKTTTARRKATSGGRARKVTARSGSSSRSKARGRSTTARSRKTASRSR